MLLLVLFFFKKNKEEKYMKRGQKGRCEIKAALFDYFQHLDTV